LTTTEKEPLQEVLDALESEPHLVYTLERNRGWLALRGHMEGRRAAYERRLMASMFDREEPVDQRRIDYLRGYFDAMDWMLSLPERMRKKLKEDENAVA
jgi:hypothetical protein